MVQTCAKKHKLTVEKAWELMEEETPPQIEDQKCFVKCVGEGLFLINKTDGKLNTTTLKHPPVYLDKKLIPLAVKNCTALKGTSVCDIAYKQEKCLFMIATKEMTEEEEAAEDEDYDDE